jgi:plastocyanin
MTVEKMLFARHMLGLFLVSIGLSTEGYAEAAYTYSSATVTTTDVTSSYSTSSTRTSTGIETYTVQVGSKSSPQAYVPNNFTAEPGDVVVFEFFPTNHSVVKADFGAPCVPASNGLFYSGMFNSFNESNGQLNGPVSMTYHRLEHQRPIQLTFMMVEDADLVTSDQ